MHLIFIYNFIQNLILTLTLKPILCPKNTIWTCEDQLKCPQNPNQNVLTRTVFEHNLSKELKTCRCVCVCVCCCTNTVISFFFKEAAQDQQRLEHLDVKLQPLWWVLLCNWSLHLVWTLHEGDSLGCGHLFIFICICAGATA